VFLVTGLSPLDLAKRSIGAFWEEKETIALYAGNCYSGFDKNQDTAAWQAVDKSAGAPDRGPEAKRSNFTGNNSAVYSGGESGLVCSGFGLLRTGSEQAGASEPRKFTSTTSRSNQIAESVAPLPDNEQASSTPATTTESSVPAVSGAGTASSSATSTNNFSASTTPEVGGGNKTSTSSPIRDREGPAEATTTGSGTTTAGLLDRFGGAYTWGKGLLTGLADKHQALAQDYIGNDIQNPAELGRLDGARLKLSLAFRAKPAQSTGGQKDRAGGTVHKAASSTQGGAATSSEPSLATSTQSVTEQASTSPDKQNPADPVDKTDAATSSEPEAGSKATSGQGDASESDAGPGAVQDSASTTARAQEISPEQVWQRLFGTQEARASRAEDKQAGLVVWYSLPAGTASGTQASSSERRVWRKLKTLRVREFSNYLNQGYLTLDAPFITGWQELEGLALRVEAKTQGTSDFQAYVDSMWVETDYKPGSKVKRIRKRQAFEKALRLLSDQTVFQMGEDAELAFHYTKKERNLLERVESLFGVESFWKNVDLEARLKGPAGRELDIPLTIIFEDDGTFTVEVPNKTGSLRPGRYSVVFRVKDSSGEQTETLEIEQEFSWGVLAMNTDQAVYRPGEAGYIQMAVLDETGHTLCNAELELAITGPTGSTTRLATTDDTITSNPACGPNNVIDTPDYYTYHRFHRPGKYKLELTAWTANGRKEMSESVKVATGDNLTLKRAGPTRIYPKAAYDMEIHLQARHGYRGKITESIPGGFAITGQTVETGAASGTEGVDFRIDNSGRRQELVWTGLDLAAGEHIELRYTFDAPDISPEFYLLGPARLDGHEEGRQWQIAADALGEFAARQGTSTGWTDAGLAWDAADDTYAYRDIPQGGADDSANHLLATSTEAADQGGTITQVEMGLEGYAGSSSVSAYLAPVFGGAATGSAYHIDNTNLGTSDDDSLDYVDITTDSQAPADWTWQAVQDLDLMAYGENSDSSQDRRLYVDQLTVRVTYNAPPTGEIVSLAQKRDGSGAVDVTLRADDPEDDDLRARVEYEAGSDCAFLATSSPTLDEADSAVTAEQGDPEIDNNHQYQVGTTTGWIVTTGGANDVYFDWLSGPDLPDADGEYCLRATVNDRQNDQLVSATSTVTVDNVEPTAPGDLALASAGNNSLTVDFNQHSSDSHFAEYKIFYKQGSSGVSPSYNLHSSSTDPDLGSNSGSTQTTVTGLATGTQYVLNIWAYDEYGNQASASEVSFFTNRQPGQAASTTQYQSDSTTTIATGAWTAEDEAVLEAKAHDQDADERLTLYFELKPNAESFTLATSVPAACASTTAYSECASKIWAATSTVGNYGTDAFTGAVSPQNIPDASEGYKWQVMACDRQGLCSDWTKHGGSPDFRLDNTPPTAPGSLSIAARATTSVKLAFGASTTEDNFSEYKIYYKQGQSGVTQSDQMHASNTDPSLGYLDYNGQASTTLTGLEQGTDYAFNVFAYDRAGNVAAAPEEATTTTVTLPQAYFNSAKLRRDGSGRADISVEVSDQDGDEVRTRLDYVAGADCDFSSPEDPTLDEADSNTTADYGDPVIDNQEFYQIGSSSGWILTDSGANTVEFDWLAAQDLPDSEGVYCLRLTATDGIYEQAEPATTTLTVDTQAPTRPGDLSAVRVTQESATLDFGSVSSDSNFAEYKIFYKHGTSGVSETDSLYGSSSDPDLGYADFRGTATTTVTGLSLGQDYVFNIWAYDVYGNSASATREVAVNTSYAPRSRVWRWYYDEASSTPQYPIGAEEEAPTSITGGNVIKLRLALAELNDVVGQDVKMRLQYSEYSDFSQDVHFVGEIGSSTPWTYADGGDRDNDPIEQTLLSESESGATHNESGISTTEYDHPASTTAEWEFTVKNNGAASSTTFYFRAWDQTDGQAVTRADGYAYPSLVTSAGSLSYAVDGLASGSSTEGVVTNVGAASGELNFGSLTGEDEVIGAQRFNITTNAENGYQLFVYQRQQMLAANGADIDPVSSTNENPSAWPENPEPSAFGYHTGDDTLSGNAPSRFAADNTYARFEGNFQEISYSPLPVENETVDFVYRLGVSEMQEAGDYVTEVVYILVPTF